MRARAQLLVPGGEPAAGLIGAGARALLTLGAVALLGGCGASTPRESDIFYDPSLRAGRVEPATEAERQLLAGLDTAPDSQPLTFGGETFLAGAAYDAASGQRCRAIEAAGVTRLACESDGQWAFVPEIVRRAPPGAPADGEASTGAAETEESP